MRVSRTAAALLAAAALLGVAAPAGAKTLITIGGSASPAITAFTTTPQPLKATVDVRFSTDVAGTLPATVTKSTIFVPHGPRVNSRLFPGCNPDTLQRQHGNPRVCPRGSRIGSGTAFGQSPQLRGVTEKVAVDVYNGPHGASLIFFLHATLPVAISGMIVAPLQAIHTHEWGYKITLKVPHSLQEVGPGIFASLQRFTTTIGGSVTVREHGRLVRHGYFEVLACPPGALVPIRGEFSFLGEASTSANGYIGCR